MRSREVMFNARVGVPCEFGGFSLLTAIFRWFSSLSPISHLRSFFRSWSGFFLQYCGFFQDSVTQMSSEMAVSVMDHHRELLENRMYMISAI